MPGKEPISERGLLFGSDSLFEVLRDIASRRGKPFHGAAVASAIGRSRKQTQSELAKLRTLGVIEPVGTKGRREQLRVADARHARAIVGLPALIEAATGGATQAKSQ